LFCKGIAKGGYGGKEDQRKQQRNTVQGIKKPAVIKRLAIKRLARRVRFKRVSNGIYNKLELFLQKIVGDAIACAEYRNGETVSVMDVLDSLKQNQ
jgi:histone H3/H4